MVIIADIHRPRQYATCRRTCDRHTTGNRDNPKPAVSRWRAPDGTRRQQQLMTPNDPSMAWNDATAWRQPQNGRRPAAGRATVHRYISGEVQVQRQCQDWYHSVSEILQVGEYRNCRRRTGDNLNGGHSFLFFDRFVASRVDQNSSRRRSPAIDVIRFAQHNTSDASFGQQHRRPTVRRRRRQRSVGNSIVLICLFSIPKSVAMYRMEQVTYVQRPLAIRTIRLCNRKRHHRNSVDLFTVSTVKNTRSAKCSFYAACNLRKTFPVKFLPRTYPSHSKAYLAQISSVRFSASLSTLRETIFFT